MNLCMDSTDWLVCRAGYCYFSHLCSIHFFYYILLINSIVKIIILFECGSRCSTCNLLTMKSSTLAGLLLSIAARSSHLMLRWRIGWCRCCPRRSGCSRFGLPLWCWLNCCLFVGWCSTRHRFWKLRS